MAWSWFIFQTVYKSMKLITGALITAVLLSGCSSESVDGSAEFKQAKSDACKKVNDFKLGDATLRVMKPLALAFHELALIDDNYLYLANAAWLALSIDDSIIFQGKSNDLQNLEYMKATSQLLQFCASG